MLRQIASSSSFGCILLRPTWLNHGTLVFLLNMQPKAQEGRSTSWTGNKPNWFAACSHSDFVSMKSIASARHPADTLRYERAAHIFFGASLQDSAKESNKKAWGELLKTCLGDLLKTCFHSYTGPYNSSKKKMHDVMTAIRVGYCYGE